MAVKTTITTSDGGQYIYVYQDGQGQRIADYTVEVSQDVNIDFNQDGQVVGIEILIDQDKGESL